MRGSGRGAAPRERTPHTAPAPAVRSAATCKRKPSHDTKKSEAAVSFSKDPSTCRQRMETKGKGVARTRKRRVSHPSATSRSVARKTVDGFWKGDSDRHSRGLFSAPPGFISSTPASSHAALSAGESPPVSQVISSRLEGRQGRRRAKKRKLNSSFNSELAGEFTDAWEKTRLAFDLPAHLHKTKPSAPPSLACLMAEAVADHLFASSAFWARFLDFGAQSQIRVLPQTACAPELAAKGETQDTAEVKRSGRDRAAVAGGADAEVDKNEETRENAATRQVPLAEAVADTAANGCACETANRVGRTPRGDESNGNSPSFGSDRSRSSSPSFASLSPASTPAASPRASLLSLAHGPGQREHTNWQVTQPRCSRSHSDSHVLAMGAIKAVDKALRAGGHGLLFPSPLAPPFCLAAPHPPTPRDFQVARCYQQSLETHLHLLALEFCEQEREQEEGKEQEEEREQEEGKEQEEEREQAEGKEQEEEREQAEGKEQEEERKGEQEKHIGDEGSHFRDQREDAEKGESRDEAPEELRDTDRRKTENETEEQAVEIEELFGGSHAPQRPSASNREMYRSLTVSSRSGESPASFDETNRGQHDVWHRRYLGRRRGLYEVAGSDEGRREGLGFPLWKVVSCELDKSAWISSLREARVCRKAATFSTNATSHCLVYNALKLLRAATAHSEQFSVYETCKPRGPCARGRRNTGTAGVSPPVSSSASNDGEMGDKPVAHEKGAASETLEGESRKATEGSSESLMQRPRSTDSQVAFTTTPFFLPSPPVLRVALFSLVQRLWPRPQGEETPSPVAAFVSALQACLCALGDTAGARGPVEAARGSGEEVAFCTKSTGAGTSFSGSHVCAFAPAQACGVFSSKGSVLAGKGDSDRCARLEESRVHLELTRHALVEEMRACAAILSRVHECVWDVQVLREAERMPQWKETTEGEPTARGIPVSEKQRKRCRGKVLKDGDEAEEPGKWRMPGYEEVHGPLQTGGTPVCCVFSESLGESGVAAERDRNKTLRGDSSSLGSSQSPDDGGFRGAEAGRGVPSHTDDASPPAGAFSDEVPMLGKDDGDGQRGFFSEKGSRGPHSKLDEAFCRAAKDVLLLEALLRVPVASVSREGREEILECERTLSQIEISLRDEREEDAEPLDGLLAALSFCRDLEERRVASAVWVCGTHASSSSQQESCEAARDTPEGEADEKENAYADKGAESEAVRRTSWPSAPTVRPVSAEAETLTELGGEGRDADEVSTRRKREPEGRRQTARRRSKAECVDEAHMLSPRIAESPVVTSSAWKRTDKNEKATDGSHGKEGEVEEDCEAFEKDSNSTKRMRGMKKEGRRTHAGFFEPNWVSRYLDGVRSLLQQAAQDLCIYITFVCEHCLPESHFTTWYAHWVGLRSYHELHAQLARERGELDAALAHLEKQLEGTQDADDEEAVDSRGWADCEDESEVEGVKSPWQTGKRRDEGGACRSSQPLRPGGVGVRGLREERHLETLERERRGEGETRTQNSERHVEGWRGHSEGGTRKRGQQERRGVMHAEKHVSDSVSPLAVASVQDQPRGRAGNKGVQAHAFTVQDYLALNNDSVSQLSNELRTPEENARPRREGRDGQRGRRSRPRQARRAVGVRSVKAEEEGAVEPDEIEDVPTQTVRTTRPCPVSAWLRGRGDRKSPCVLSPEKSVSLGRPKPSSERTPRSDAGASSSSSRFRQYACGDESPEGPRGNAGVSRGGRASREDRGPASVPVAKHRTTARLGLAAARAEGDEAPASGEQDKRLALCKHENSGEAVHARSSGSLQTSGWTASSCDTGGYAKDEAQILNANLLAVKKERRLRWTAEETQIFVRGVNEYGVGNWKRISRHYGHLLGGRTNMQLKDKWLNLVKHNHVVSDAHSDTWSLRDLP
ncbi:UNVERIFIED_CONTAM: Myb family DNA-binding domain-containing protein [Hammondia hammondi]|eukprot:XP_008884881.1 Myb family DNA-binding domain-containing protein [Hammondia hammondi]